MNTHNLKYDHPSRARSYIYTSYIYLYFPINISCISPTPKGVIHGNSKLQFQAIHASLMTIYDLQKYNFRQFMLH